MTQQQQALSGATQKLRTWQPQHIPMDEVECNVYRQLVIQAVFSVWSFEHRPTDLKEIYEIVQCKVAERRKQREWPFPAFRGKRTVDRRVNEAASPAFYENGIPKIVAVTSGIYMVSPKLFDVKMLELPRLKEAPQ